MDSVARGLTALSPSIGAAEDFIAKKGIPEDQVPAFLAKLGDPQLAGLIAQKQRLKQEQAKQVPPGGPQKSPPTVKDEINQQLVQLMQAKQQQAQQPPMPGMPPQGAMPPQGGQPPMPPVQAAGGGLMGMGLGGLDAGAMEAPRHFDGGGVVAFSGTTGSVVKSGSTVKSKEEVEKGKTTTPAPANPYSDVYKLAEQQIKDIEARTPYKRLEDPTIQEREELYAKRLEEAKREYEEDLRNSRSLANADALEAAFSGKSLGRTVAISMKSQKEKQIAARDKYSALQDKLQDAVVNLHVATQANKEEDNKATWQDKRNAEKEVAAIRAEMAKTKVAESEADFEHTYKTKSLAAQNAQAYRPTDLQNATNDFYKDLKAAQIKNDPTLKGLTDAQLMAKAREKAMTLVTGMKQEGAGEQNWVDNLKNFDTAVDNADANLKRARALSSAKDPETDPVVIAAKQRLAEATNAQKVAYQKAGVNTGTAGSPTVSNW